MLRTGASDLWRRPLRLFRPEVRRDRALLVQDDAREGRAHDPPCGGDREPHSRRNARLQIGDRPGENHRSGRVLRSRSQSGHPGRIVLRRNLRPGPARPTSWTRRRWTSPSASSRAAPTGPAPRPTVCVSSAFRTSSPSPTGGTTISPPPSWAIIRTRNTRSSSRPPA